MLGERKLHEGRMGSGILDMLMNYFRGYLCCWKISKHVLAQQRGKISHALFFFDLCEKELAMDSVSALSLGTTGGADLSSNLLAIACFERPRFLCPCNNLSLRKKQLWRMGQIYGLLSWTLNAEKYWGDDDIVFVAHRLEFCMLYFNAAALQSEIQCRIIIVQYFKRKYYDFLEKILISFGFR